MCDRHARVILLAFGWAVALSTNHGRAQSVDLAQAVVPLVPGLTVTVLSEQPQSPPGYCSDPSSWECVQNNPGMDGYQPTDFGTDAAGNAYYIAIGGSGGYDLPQTLGSVLRRRELSGTSAIVALMVAVVCFPDCSTGYQADARYVMSKHRLDLVNGYIELGLYAWLHDYVSGEDQDLKTGIVRISGLPKLFDTLLTFMPGQQALKILTPAHPDGFRSADSLQVWTGNVRSMPDWSQAAPLTCEAAANPAPGQIVSVLDTLPDPAVGEGRYYLAASQNGVDRRLGRQYINGAFSARAPTALPDCDKNMPPAGHRVPATIDDWGNR